MIVVLAGASGAGKSTIGAWLRKRFGDALKPVVSITTRVLRDTEPSGEYLRVPDEEFEKMKQAGKFIWDVCPFGTDKYGTLFQSLEETKLEPNTISLMILEPDSVGTLHIHKERMGLKIAPFYVISPSVEELRRRLEIRFRQERDKKIAKMRAQSRLESDIWEWLKQQRPKDQDALERRLQDCLKWDERALEAKIPYIFIRNDLDDNGQKAAATVATEIIERIMAK